MCDMWWTKICQYHSSSEYFSFPDNYHPTNAPYLFKHHPGLIQMGPVVAAVPTDPASLHPKNKNIMISYTLDMFNNLSNILQFQIRNLCA